MLYVTRKRGESIDLLDHKTQELLAVIHITEIMPSGVVRVGVDADPRMIDIRRDNMRHNRNKELINGNQNQISDDTTAAEPNGNR